jgi:hypothetical protein
MARSATSANLQSFEDLHARRGDATDGARSLNSGGGDRDAELLCLGHHFFEAQPFHLRKQVKRETERRIFLHSPPCIFTSWNILSSSSIPKPSAKVRESPVWCTLKEKAVSNGQPSKAGDNTILVG